MSFEQGWEPANFLAAPAPDFFFKRLCIIWISRSLLSIGDKYINCFRFFSQAAPAPALAPGIFFRAAPAPAPRGQGAKNTWLRPAPAP